MLGSVARVKVACGQGVKQTFPAEVEGRAPEKINAYDNRSPKCPATLWWALGGFAVWLPGAKLDQAFKGSMPEEQLAHIEDNGSGVGMWNCVEGAARERSEDGGSFFCELSRCPRKEVTRDPPKRSEDGRGHLFERPKDAKTPKVNKKHKR